MCGSLDLRDGQLQRLLNMSDCFARHASCCTLRTQQASGFLNLRRQTLNCSCLLQPLQCMVGAGLNHTAAATNRQGICVAMAYFGHKHAPGGRGNALKMYGRQKTGRGPMRCLRREWHLRATSAAANTAALMQWRTRGRSAAAAEPPLAVSNRAILCPLSLPDDWDTAHWLRLYTEH